MNTFLKEILELALSIPVYTFSNSIFDQFAPCARCQNVSNGKRVMFGIGQAITSSAIADVVAKTTVKSIDDTITAFKDIKKKEVKDNECESTEE